MRKLMILPVALAAILPLVADTWTDPDTGYTWYYRINGNMAEMSGISPKPIGALTIPSALGGKTVMSIKSEAFLSCDEITSVVIPNSVTTIEWEAFAYCSGLTSVTIPDGVTSIGSFAFYNCSGLTSVTIPDGVTYIGEYAFKGTPFYNDQPDGLVVFGKVVYELKGYCPTVVTIPDGVTSIGAWAFENCSDLTSVTIPNSVTRIGEFAFSGCSGLTSVTIPDSVTSIDYGAFSDCGNLRRVSIGGGVTSIPCSAFEGCERLSDITIGGNVKSIEEQAFAYCIRLVDVTVPSNVKYIGYNAFVGCDNLRNVVLPKMYKNLMVYYDDAVDAWHYEQVKASQMPTPWERESFEDTFVYFAFADGDEDWQIKQYKMLIILECITYKDVKAKSTGGKTAVTVPEAWQKARTLRGRAMRALPPPYDLQGVFELKCGKANKKGIAKVSATLTGMDGKKKSYKAQSVDVTGQKVKVDFGGFSVTITGETFTGGEGLPGGLSVESAEVGGNWTRSGAAVAVDFSAGGLPAGALEELLPAGEPVIPKGGKWAFNKASGVKWAKDKVTKEYGLVVDTSKDKTNRSAMKLTYTPKTGLFKGTFKVYALEEASGGKKKLKKYTVNVIGFVVDGVGTGQATCKKPAGGPWSVTVE